MKKIFFPFLHCFFFMIVLSACHYSPPDGFAEKHHTYEEVLAYAKSIDPSACVTEQYMDTTNENGWKFREWDATINGAECHIASVSDWVWNDGFLAGEYAKDYYRIDTDYDYTILNHIILAEYRNWVADSDPFSKYHSQFNGERAIFVLLKADENKQLTNIELDEIWNNLININEAYQKNFLNRRLVFTVPSPQLLFNHHGEQADFVNKTGITIIDNLTEQGKKDFFKKYSEAWELLDSDLPKYEVDQ